MNRHDIYNCNRWNNNNLWKFKIHAFTGPGTFQQFTSASTPANNLVDYLVIGGGGGGGQEHAVEVVELVDTENQNQQLVIQQVGRQVQKPQQFQFQFKLIQ